MASVTIKFKEVCYSCPNIDTYVNDNSLYGDDRLMIKLNTIGCNHEKVCKDYLDSEE